LPEAGLVSPGELVIGADSHTCTYGALGCFAVGVGSTDLARAFADGKCWFKVPAGIKYIYKGRLKKWVGGKDLILFTIGKIGVDGALYGAMEFCGPVIERLPMDDRFTMSNMAIEAGARTGLIAPDDTTWEYLRKIKNSKIKIQNYNSKFKNLESDKDARYEKIYEWDVSGLEPQVACPHLPSNVKPVAALSKVKIDQVVIGSCTNGRISDLAVAARVLKGKRVKPGLKLIVIPATQKVYLEAVNKGWAEIFVRAGGVFSTPSCGPCLGGHLGILAEGEVALATTNRNFIGRMGSPKSFVYLSNPAVAAASAVTGKISHPDDVV
jgi:3-isopropylmalate/(R)-2-methylmalate dehydratase large subunit